MKNIPKVIGSVSISYNVECPHCKKDLDDYYDRDWWNKSIDLGEGWEVSHDVECPHCEKAFEIEKFEH